MGPGTQSIIFCWTGGPSMKVSNSLQKTTWQSFCRKAVQGLGGILALLLLSLPAHSQSSNGRILGTVTDVSGGVVAGATGPTVGVVRGVFRTLTTDERA